MARQRGAAKPSSKKKTTSSTLDGSPPAPFKAPPDVLQPLIATLDPAHVYILHVDTKPAAFKRKIFLVPVLMNVGIVLALAWRAWAVGPWYLRVLASTLGYANDTTLVAAELPWPELLLAVARRAATFMLDFVLVVFLWPWPVEFFAGRAHGNPAGWRWRVGFRDREVVARRSRGTWDKGLKEGGGVTAGDDEDGGGVARNLFMAQVSLATAPMHLRDKTGYLLMNAEWDLDWGVMTDATAMVDRRMAAVEAFTLVVLVHTDSHGWLALDTKTPGGATNDAHQQEEDQRRRQVFAFRDALAALGKEDLFYRWIEIIQFESTQPGGFGVDRQVQVAQQVRDLFKNEDIDFDAFWKEAVGSENLAGM